MEGLSPQEEIEAIADTIYLEFRWVTGGKIEIIREILRETMERYRTDPAKEMEGLLSAFPDQDAELTFKGFIYLFENLDAIAVKNQNEKSIIFMDEAISFGFQEEVMQTLESNPQDTIIITGTESDIFE